MAKKKMWNKSAYYEAQKGVTEVNRLRKQAKHKKAHPNDNNTHKNPQLPQNQPKFIQTKRR